MLAHNFSSRTQEAKAGRCLSSSQPSLYSKFQDSQGFIVTLDPILNNNSHPKRNFKINFLGLERWVSS